MATSMTQEEFEYEENNVPERKLPDACIGVPEEDCDEDGYLVGQ